MIGKVVGNKAKALKKFFKKDFRILFVQLYIIVLVIGFVLTLLYAVFPSFLTCNNFFGEQFCTPTGMFIGLVASLPGYVVAGNLLTPFGELPTFLSFIIVVLVSGIFYYLIGLLIDKAKKKKFSKAEIIIIVSFILLALSLILLLVRLM